MKTIKSYLNGAITITENAGSLFLNMDDSIGGGAAKGIFEGKATLSLGANQALDVLETDLNKIVPATFLPLVLAVEAVANSAIKAIE